MTALELARWQFGITTVYHFIFVPLTIGLAFFIACLQTAHHRTGKDVYGRMTRFWGKLMLISFAARCRHRDRSGVPVRHELVATTPASSVTSSVRRWRWRASPPSSSSRPSSASGSSAGAGFRRGSTWPRSGWSPARPRSRPTSSSPPTRGCSTRSATRWSDGKAQLTSIWAVLDQQHRAVRLRPHDPRRALHRRHGDRWASRPGTCSRGHDVEVFRRSRHARAGRWPSSPALAHRRSSVTSTAC